ncbi:bifunctional endoribonuclease/protein kinase ire1 [Coemansia sp. Benny D160-2]|nr:bifunctional endoribonuclease/protein kinase ire1 [Coemansia sp. Benny D160-2]
MLELVQQTQSRAGGQAPSVSHEFLCKPIATECRRDPGDAESLCMAHDGIECPYIDNTFFEHDTNGGSIYTSASAADDYKSGVKSRHSGSLRRHKLSKQPTRPERNGQSQNQRPMLLDKGSNGIVPRKFTIPEPLVVAGAADNPIEMFPAKPYTAAASENMLLKRTMLERSGVSLVDTMVVVTVDGSMYGVSRYDGSIVWSRPGLPGRASGRHSKQSYPLGMVWTKHGVEMSLVNTSSSERICDPADNIDGAANSTDTSAELGNCGSMVDDSSHSIDDDDYEDSDGEEEWLLEQGIDWRSEPHILEKQRQRRREWLAKQKNRHNKSTESFSNPDVDEFPEILYIAEPGNDGALYMYNAEIGLKKLPLTIKDLADQSPVQVRGVLYTGSKEARFTAIDLNSGRLLKTYGDEQSYGSDSRDSAHRTSQRFSERRTPIRLLLGEKLNQVRIFPDKGSGSAGISGNDMPQWELYHRCIHAPALDPEIDDILTELSDAIEALGSESSRSDSDNGDSTTRVTARGPTKFVMTHDGGFVMVEAATGIPLWAQEFDSPVVSAFDVFGISSPSNDNHEGTDDKGGKQHVDYVARKRNLSPMAQQMRYRRWRQLHALDDQERFYERFSSGRSQSQSQDSRWRTGSSGGNILAGAFWERSGVTTAPSLPQIAYIGKLQDTLYTLTADEFPLIDHASLTSSLLLALVQAKRDQQRYPELQHSEWWDRWNFLTHDATVLRVLQEARAWWLGTPTSENGLVPENSFEQLLDVVRQHRESQADRAPGAGGADQLMCDVGTGNDRCYYGGLVGLHPVEPLVVPGRPTLEETALHRLGLPSNEDVPANDHADVGVFDGEYAEENARPEHGRAPRIPWDDEQLVQSTGNSGPAAQLKDDAEDWPWWRYVGHYVTRVAAFIGYMVTITLFLVFAGAMYLLRPRNKRRPRMWVDAAGDDTNAPGRRARLRISWALMHRMWATLKEEWNMALEEAWRNPNAAAVLRRTGVARRSGLRKEDEGRSGGSGNDSSSDADSGSNGSSLGRSSSSNNLALHQRQNSGVFRSNVGNTGVESSRSSRQNSVSRRGSASGSPASLGVFGRDDSEPSSLERLSSGMATPRRNSTGTLPMTPLKRALAEGDSIERLQQTSLSRGGQGNQQSQQVRLGAISLSDQVLGYGSHGTVVYRGEFQGRAVAVKRLLLDFYDVADHEVQVLQESDTHPNVIRYFCTERHDHFMYIALELCCGSLADAIMHAPKARLASQLLSAIPKKTALYQLARGLHHLHALKLVHRDIKPQNILIAPPPHRRRRRRAPSTQIDADGDCSGNGDGDGELAFEDSNIVAGGVPRVLISDFGLSRILDDDESSFANTFTMHGMAALATGGANGAMHPGFPVGMIGCIGGGTVGWRAPECFDSPEARVALGPMAGVSTIVDQNGEQPSWPSLNGVAPAAVDEPSPYVSRGTRSRLRSLAMAQIPRAVDPNIATSAEETQQQGQQTKGEELDSRGTDTTDRAGSSIPFASSNGTRRRMTRAVDIFSMGCVFYYVLMDGAHPFGDRLSREQRILAGTPDLQMLESSCSDIPSAVEAVDLIAHMVARQERDRPSAASVLVHPYFWDATQRLNFLQDVSDCLEAEARLIKAAREDVPEPPSAKKAKSAKKKGGNQSAAAATAAVTGSNPGGAVDKEAAGANGSSSHAMSRESIEDIIGKLPSLQAAAVHRAITLLDTFEENGTFVMDGAPPSADGFQIVGMPPPSNPVVAVDTAANAIGSADRGGNRTRDQRPRRITWDRRLDPHLRRDLSKFRKYDSTRLRDLLRTIRNKKNHYQDMPILLRETLGDIPEGYLHYFESRFPYLLLHCYYFVLEDDSLRTATVFKPYFRPPAL